MALPAPNLDDRRFQSLVDDAKRLVQQRCPEWTDHNVSDPGVTLIETFAYMADQLIYRLNRVPDRLYVKFLDLIGVTLFAPSAASTDVTFWLSAPQTTSVIVPAGVEVATPRGSLDTPAVVFTVARQLDIVPCESELVCSIPAGGTVRNHTDSLALAPFSCFSPQPLADDVLLIGLSTAVPRCVVNIRLDCEIQGIGVDPTHPPLVWEAYNGESWVECDLEEDTTGGLNRRGDVVLHVPETHVLALIKRLRAGWIRARVLAPEDGQPFYKASPVITKVSAFTIGGTIGAVQAEAIAGEVIGVSEGVAGQVFHLDRPPVVVTDEPPVLEVSDDEEGWQEWAEVSDFAASGPDDRHFVIDHTTGMVSFGPMVRNADGSITRFGATPPKNAVLRMRRYRTGGGGQGNVAKGAISISRTAIPFVSTVENRRPAWGGVDGETVDEAKIRGPIVLRTLGRAVTAEDYEQLAREAAPDAARIRAVPATAPEEAGGVRVLVVPAVADDENGRLRFEQLAPEAGILQTVAAALDRKRTIGARVIVEPPAYQGATVVAMMRARPWADPGKLQAIAVQALYDHLHPISGGIDGSGWPFGRPVLIGEVFALLQGLPGAEVVEDVLLFAANPITGQRGQPSQRVDLAPNALVFSYEHQVRVEGAMR